MKYGTGRPKRTRTTKPKPTLASLTPLDRIHSGNVTMAEACVYLRVSMPTAYKMVQAGLLKTVTVGGKRFATPASVKAVIDGNAEAPKRAPKFTPIRTVGRRATKPAKARVAA
jgi:excisionase family DNA binding protein